MVRRLKGITASTGIKIKNQSFTPNEVLYFLKSIEELKNYPITVNELDDGTLQYIVGNSVYEFSDI